MFHCGGCVGVGVLLPTIPLKAVGNLGRRALDDSSDYFGKCPVLWRKKVGGGKLACEEEEEMKSLLEIWVLRDQLIGPARSPLPQEETLGYRLAEMSHTQSQISSCPEDRKKTDTYTSTHGNQKPGLPFQGRGQNW